jgi:hypothetical protein
LAIIAVTGPRPHRPIGTNNREAPVHAGLGHEPQQAFPDELKRLATGLERF